MVISQYSNCSLGCISSHLEGDVQSRLDELDSHPLFLLTIREIDRMTGWALGHPCCRYGSNSAMHYQVPILCSPQTSEPVTNLSSVALMVVLKVIIQFSGVTHTGNQRDTLLLRERFCAIPSLPTVMVRESSYYSLKIARKTSVGTYSLRVQVNQPWRITSDLLIALFTDLVSGWVRIATCWVCSMVGFPVVVTLQKPGQQLCWIRTSSSRARAEGTSQSA